jgi:protein involved in polysaccharide export with SLBB domain
MKTIIAIAVILMTGCGNPVSHLPEFRQNPVTTPQPIPAVRGGAYYRLVPYDQINVRFPYHPEQDSKPTGLNSQPGGLQSIGTALQIQPDGNITLDSVGTIRAAGLTPDELAKLIADKASARLRDPQVIVTIVQYAPRRVFVGGEVNAPGPVQIQEGMTPMQAIFDRGGFKDTAQKDGVVLIRDAGSENPQIGRIDLFGSLEKGTPEVITLLTNDVIYVPMTGIGRASTWIRQHLREILPIELIGAAGMAAGS